MNFQTRKYTFRGMDGYAGFRNGQDYELELAASEETEERPSEVVVINPVSKVYSYYSKSEFAKMFERTQ